MSDREPGRYYEDVVIGEGFVSGAQVVTAETILAFGRLSGDEHPLHTDETFCRDAGFPGLLAHGLLGLSILGGLKASVKIYADAASVSLGWDKVQFRRPLVAGDTVRAHIMFAEKQPASDGRRGVVRQQAVLRNQREEIVTEAEHLALVRLRPIA